LAETCWDTERYNNINKKLLVVIAGISLKDSYVYIMQQDAPHKDKIMKLSLPKPALSENSTDKLKEGSAPLLQGLVGWTFCRLVTIWV
jgi:hypothetical protein